MNTPRFAFIAVPLVFALILLPLHSPAEDWSVSYLDDLLSRVQPDQRTVLIGDMEILVKNVRAWRNQLAGRFSPQAAFDGVVPIWTDGKIYYTFDPSVSAAKQRAFLDGANEWAMVANLQFIARTTQANYMTVVENPGLGGGQSAVGMIGGQQFLQLGPSAWNRPTICHELGHTLGMQHEHQRSDRDSFVQVFTNNVAPGQLGNFIKLGNTRNAGPYDFLSVMHYGTNSFSIDPNTLNTLYPLPAYNQFAAVVGAKFDPVLSFLDRAGMVTNYGLGPALTSVVTNTADSGPGTLRAALYYAFDHPGTTITFNIPTTDPGFSNSVFNILLTDGLQGLVNSTTVDTTTQPTNSNPNGPEILLNGVRCDPQSTFPAGIKFTGTNCLARGFIISGFPSSGVVFAGTTTRSNTLSSCYVGVNPAGTAPATNGILPVDISSGASWNIVGGNLATDRNVISGSRFQGLTIHDIGTHHNIVQGNYIGLNATGTGALPNTWSGIQIYGGAQSNRIGGATVTSFNIISGNSFQGIAISETNTIGNVIDGNFIGLNPAGNAAIPNGWAGIDIFGGACTNFVGLPSASARNVISGNGNQGVAIGGSGTFGNVVSANLIGLTSSGSSALGNTYSGVGIFNEAKGNIIGGTTANSRNVISGNVNQGVVIANPNTRGNVILGNYIGLNATGTAAVPNAWSGVNLFDGPDNNLVGGTTPGSANVISGNGLQGVVLQDPGTRNNSVQGNLIGLHPAGSAAIPNTWSGIEISGGPHDNLIGGSAGARNFISGNGNFGIFINNNSAANLVRGNTISVDVSNSTVIPNSFANIAMFSGARSNQIGGITAGDANLIRGALSDGVQVADAASTNNSVRGNSIFGNGGTGIALYNNANLNAVAPVLSSAVLTTNTTVMGSLTSIANTTFQLDFYSDVGPATSAEGMTYLGSRSVTTSAGGVANFTINLEALVPPGRVITAAATDPANNTSRLSVGVTNTVTSGANDNIPNAWRAVYFGGTGATTNAQSCATCDPDGDGVNNRAEFLAGTNPTNTLSQLRLEALTANGSGNVASFLSSTGIVYRLEYRDSLSTGGWGILADQVIGTGGTWILSDPNPSPLPQRFYRAEVLW